MKDYQSTTKSGNVASQGNIINSKNLTVKAVQDQTNEMKGPHRTGCQRGGPGHIKQLSIPVVICQGGFMCQWQPSEVEAQHPEACTFLREPSAVQAVVFPRLKFESAYLADHSRTKRRGSYRELSPRVLGMVGGLEQSKSPNSLLQLGNHAKYVLPSFQQPLLK